MLLFFCSFYYWSLFLAVLFAFIVSPVVFFFSPVAAKKFVDEGLTTLEGQTCCSL